MGKGKYPLQPPSAPKNYQSTNNDDVRDSDSSTVSSSGSQQDTGGLPEDFKVNNSVSFSRACVDLSGFQYGVTVSRCSQDIRNAFVRKVYTILRM